MAAYTQCLRCAGAPRRPAGGSGLSLFHSFLASNGSVALPVAGYNYNSDLTPLLAGLAPAGMAASLAAPEPYVRLSRIRLPPRVCDGESGRIRSSAFVTRAWLWVQYVLCWC